MFALSAYFQTKSSILGDELLGECLLPPSLVVFYGSRLWWVDQLSGHLLGYNYQCYTTYREI